MTPAGREKGLNEREELDKSLPGSQDHPGDTSATALLPVSSDFNCCDSPRSQEQFLSPGDGFAQGQARKTGSENRGRRSDVGAFRGTFQASSKPLGRGLAL